MVGLGLSSEALVSSVVDRATPTVARPKEGDVLVFAFGPREGEVIKPDDIAPAVPQVFAYPMDPSTGEVGSDSRLNQVMLVRVDPGGLSEDTLARSADGVVAYSGVCTHTGATSRTGTKTRCDSNARATSPSSTRATVHVLSAALPPGGSPRCP